MNLSHAQRENDHLNIGGSLIKKNQIYQIKQIRRYMVNTYIADSGFEKTR